MSTTAGLDRIASPAGAAALVLGIGAATILTALAFEHIGGYLPCPLCVQQRWAYYLGLPVAAGALALAWTGHATPARGLLALVGVAFLANAGLGVFHAGVEWGWWAGPAGCAVGSGLATGTGDLLQSLRQTQLVPCDRAPWTFAGLSFAGWNAVVSAGLAGIAICGAARRES